MASKSNDDITLSKQVIEMATVANEFCYFVENIEKKGKGDSFGVYATHFATTSFERFLVTRNRT